MAVAAYVLLLTVPRGSSLRNRNVDQWKGEVTVVATDMREWTPPTQADILVSELLGSFGDNELSPECLDGAQKLLKGYLPAWVFF